MVHVPKERPTGIAGGWRGGWREMMHEGNEDALDSLRRLVAESMTRIHLCIWTRYKGARLLIDMKRRIVS